MGWVYNLKTPDPHSHVTRVIAICLVFPLLAFLAVILRLYVRIHTKRAAWLDDYASLFSAILALAYGAIAIAQSRWGLGLDAQYFPEENIVPFSRVQYAGGPVYTLALLGFKVSLLASYLRIGGFIKAYRIVIVGVIVACVCNQVIFTFVLCFACRPVARQWDLSIPGTCIDAVASYYALAGISLQQDNQHQLIDINIISGTSLAFDCIIIALPLPVLMNLHLRRRQKAALVAVFALGFFVTVIQIIRIFTIKNLKTYTDSQPIVLWSVIEISLGVLISCIPTYAPLFHTLTSTLTSYRPRRTAQSYRLTSATGSGTGTSRKKTKTGAGRPFDSSLPHTTTIMSAAAGQKVSSDGDSEERILPPDASASASATAEMRLHAHKHKNESEMTLAEGEREREGGIQIHTMTEVRVESCDLKG
ncbi:putative integral membrane protein (Pth11) [Aspergillus thermomutatus]|uniref:Rhodopsin domain-containing protein n=1 Tax=Aspergillus thermomutatus TaxID=41047 RepID=A0A397HEV8_ASPTH|nr:uncharacterized protein CDV56_108596 [Aspergillus thermomutatus]RHZ59823.1 hypothetical protein CDV56_108596 [Aspergillus thermomutatus]